MRRLYDFILEEARTLLTEASERYDPEKARQAPSMSSLKKGGRRAADPDLKKLYFEFKEAPADQLLKSVMGQSTLSDIGGGETGSYTDPAWAEVLHLAFSKMDRMSNEHFAKLLAGPPEYVIGTNKKPGIFIPMNPEWRKGVVGSENKSMKLCAYWCSDLVVAMFKQGFFGTTSSAAQKEIIGGGSKGLRYARSPAKDGIYIFKGQFASFGAGGD